MIKIENTIDIIVPNQTPALNPSLTILKRFLLVLMKRSELSEEFADFCISVENSKEEYGPSTSFMVHLVMILPFWSSFCKQIIFKDDVKTKKDVFERIQKIKNKKKTYKDLHANNVKTLIDWVYSKNENLFGNYKNEKECKELLRTIKELDLTQELKVLVSFLEMKEYDTYWFYRYSGEENSLKVYEGFIYPEKGDEMKNYIIESLSDIKVKVGNEIYKSHKCILSRSAFLYTYLKSWNNNENTLDIEEGEMHFKQIIEYLYIGKVKLNEETAIDFLFWANKYVLIDLQKEIEKYIEPLISEENVCQILILSTLILSNNLKEISKKFIIQRIISDEKHFQNLFFPQLDSNKNLVNEILFDVQKVKKMMAVDGKLMTPTNNFGFFF